MQTPVNPDNQPEEVDEVNSFINDVVDKDLLRSLNDLGLSQFTIDWLVKEANVPPLYARVYIKMLALLADKAGKAVGKYLLILLRQTRYYNVTKDKLRDLLSYIHGELRAKEEVRQVLAGQRSAKVGIESAKYLPLDLRGIIRLISGVEELTEFIAGPLTALLNPQPVLELKVFEEDPTGLNRFLYGTQKTSFLGREKEIHALEAFLAAPQRFCWWIVTGEGGLGKSRLALELCLRNGNVWRAGFLPTSFSLDDYRHWAPNQSTLIIADYAAYRAIEIGHIIRIMKTHADNNRVPFPVRLLLLERHERRYFRGKPYDIDVMQEAWFKRLLGVGADRETILSAWYARRVPMVLGALNQEATWKILCTFAFGKEEGPMEEKDQILSALETIDPRLCRPLYAALLGDAIAAGRQYSQLGTLDTLIDILEREEERFWKPQWELAGITTREDRDNDKDVLALATMAGGIDMESASLSPAIKAMIKRPSFSSERYARMAPGSTNTLLRPLTPDIIGEAFVLQHLKPDNPLQTERLDRIKTMAWSLSADNTIAFLYRAETDFPNHSTLAYLRRIS